MNKLFLNSEKGVSLIITFFAMVIILGVHLAVATILYGEIKIIKNIGESVSAFYAAESGIEKVLYFDRKILLESDGLISDRGICAMCRTDIFSSACAEEPESGGGDKSLYCNDCVLTLNAENGCDPYHCMNCQIEFGTNIDGNKKYSVVASVGSNDAFEFPEGWIDATGYYKNNVLRAVRANMVGVNPIIPPE